MRDAFKLYVCEDGRWEMAQRYGADGERSAIGAAKMSLRASSVAAIRLVHEYVPSEQNVVCRELLMDVVKDGEDPPPPPAETTPIAAPARIQPTAGSKTAKPAPAGQRRRAKNMSTGQRLALATGTGTTGAIAGPLLFFGHALSDLTAGPTALGTSLYLTALGIFVAVFAATMFMTAEPAAARSPAAAPAPIIDTRPTARISPILLNLAQNPAASQFDLGKEKQAPPSDFDAAGSGRMTLLRFLHASLAEGEAKKILASGALEGISRFGFLLYVFGAAELCLAAMPSGQTAEIAEMMATTMAAIGGDPSQARDLATRIGEFRQATKNATMIRAGHDAMSIFLRDNKPSGSSLVAALAQWNAIEQKAAAETSQDVALMFTDMVVTPDAADALGERGMMTLVEQHNLIVGVALKLHRGHMVKHTGDGIMAVFPRLADGLSGACEIQRQIAEYNAATAGAALAVRIGLAAGNPIRRDDDYFGTVVQTAARLCAYASPGEIALPETMSVLPEAANFAYDAPRPASLKGFAAALSVRKLLWGG